MIKSAASAASPTGQLVIVSESTASANLAEEVDGEKQPQTPLGAPTPIVYNAVSSSLVSC